MGFRKREVLYHSKSSHHDPMTNKYQIHFRQTTTPLALTENVLHENSYGRLDYISLQKGDEIVGFLTPKGVEQAGELGLKLLDDIYFQNIADSMNAIDDELADTSSIADVEQMSPKELIDQWHEMKKRIVRVSSFYFFADQPILAPLE